jgi:hypothetical protein
MLSRREKDRVPANQDEPSCEKKRAVSAERPKFSWSESIKARGSAEHNSRSPTTGSNRRGTDATPCQREERPVDGSRPPCGRQPEDCTPTKGTSSFGPWAEKPTVSFSPEANSAAPTLRLIRSALHCCPAKSGGRSSSSSHIPAKQRLSFEGAIDRLPLRGQPNVPPMETLK